MIRISVTAGHTRKQLVWALGRFAKAGAQFGLLRPKS
jgi:hypothetical protein